MAVCGDITESNGAATTGRSKWYASICQPTETSSGSRVRREGTTAMSSKENARRPRLPRPISISLLTGPDYRRVGGPWEGDATSPGRPATARDDARPARTTARRHDDDLDGGPAGGLRHGDHGARRRGRPRRHGGPRAARPRRDL